MQYKLKTVREPTLVSSVMTKQIIALTRSDTLERAETLFNRFKIKHIPVVSGETVIGMLSFTDLMRISYVEASRDDKGKTLETVVYNTYTIEQVMVKDVVTIQSYSTVLEAAKVLAGRGFHALPVVEDGSLVGIVTTRDLLNFFAKHF